ncbi:unnamed protein product [Periconia digitata]|uniref:Myb-like domain-containing protein n=1 Tax=Periconia digitata TaxID=1303443 RepID=A0A9W4UKZ8_9PLEO|nr:unnamed protein product [Periconia digitata]
MESRIATLLGDSSSSSSLDRAGQDALPILPPPSLAPRRPPHPLEPNATVNNEEALNTASKQQQKRQKPSVPIAGVLNHETPTPNVVVPTVPTASPSSLPPFSGRLSDLLLDPSQQHVNKKRRLDDHGTSSSSTTTTTTTNNAPVLSTADRSDNKLKLPEPTQQPSKKTPKRPRIPPLLQGLHHPPPLPEKAFPPITGEGSGFGRDIGERAGVRSPVHLSKIEERESRTDVNREDATSAQVQKDGRETNSKLAAVSTSDKENRDLPADSPAPTTEKTSKTKETRKRNKWSDQETKDLLVGVSRFGIGNWKKILTCEDFTFNQRTTIDLKDRFRVCCPGEGLKLRKPRRKHNPVEAPTQVAPSASAPSSSTASTSQDVETTSDATTFSKTVVRSYRSRTESDRKGPADLAKLGIHAPFIKRKRRERREFTQADDANLLIGFEKYNTSWHLMRDDTALGFKGRHATDLRDRFRIRYPEKFAGAGCKPKSKDEAMLKEKRNAMVAAGTHAASTVEKQKDAGDEEIVDSTSQSSRSKEPNGNTKPRVNTTTTPPSSSKTTASSQTALPTATSSSSLAPSASRPLYRSLTYTHGLPFPNPLIPDSDSNDNDDADEIDSPIVLSRNILQWVETHPLQTTNTTASTSGSMSNNLLSVMSSFNSGSTMESAHLPTFHGLSADGIDTDGTFTHAHAPMSLLTSTVPSMALSSMSSSTTHPQSSFGSTQHTPNTNGVSISTTTPSSSFSSHTTNPSKHTPASIPHNHRRTHIVANDSANHLLRTPNLPTMMYPPVPESSARSSLHNLPPPAHLLSGLDYHGYDGRVHPGPTPHPATGEGVQASGFVLQQQQQQQVDEYGAASTGSGGSGGASIGNTGPFLFTALPPSALTAGAMGTMGVGVGVGLHVGFDMSATLAPMVSSGSHPGTGSGSGASGGGMARGSGFHLDRELMDTGGSGVGK